MKKLLAVGSLLAAFLSFGNEVQEFENSTLVMNQGTDREWTTTVLRYVQSAAKLSTGDCFWKKAESTYRLECPFFSRKAVLEFRHDPTQNKSYLVGHEWKDTPEAAPTQEIDLPPPDLLNLEIASLKGLTVAKVIDQIRERAGNRCDFTWDRFSSTYHVECMFSQGLRTVCFNWQLERAPGNRALLSGHAGDCVSWETHESAMIPYVYATFLELAKAMPD